MRPLAAFALAVTPAVAAPVVIDNGQDVDRERITLSEEGVVVPGSMGDRRRERGGYLVGWRDGRTGQPGARRIISGRLLVRLQAGTDVGGLAREVGAIDLGNPVYAQRVRIFEVGAARAAEVVERLRRDARVRSADLILGKPRHCHAAPDDPLYSRLWHLENTGQNGGVSGIDINVEEVWGTFGGPGKRGAGVRIAIIDDGVESAHPDLLVDTTDDRNWNSGPENDANPGAPTDNHGTAVAGVVGARGGNALGVCGVAPEATLVAERLLGDGFPANPDDWEEAEAFAWLVNNGPRTIDIKNNSWGAADLLDIIDGPGPLAREALRFATTHGRDGRGTIFVFSAGNGGSRPAPALGEDSNLNGYANSIFGIAVAGITDGGEAAYYSEAGSNILVCAPAQASIDDSFHDHILTTDRTGADGYNTNAASATGGNFTRFFNGTSAAAPSVSGVCALVLETNPSLGWRDVQEILLRTAVRIQSEDAGWALNGDGRWFHHDFGAGLVDAAAACALATSWVPLDHMKSAADFDDSVIAIPDADPAGAVVELALVGTHLRCEHVTVTLDVTHPARGQLDISLVSPAGTVSRLVRPRSDPNPNYPAWTFSTVHCWGEQADGTWMIKVADVVAGGTGTVNLARLTGFGTSPVPDAYESWRRDVFGSAVVDDPSLRVAVWGESADPDADGFGNLSEAYLDMNPLQPDVPAEWSLRAEGGDFILRWRPSALNGLEAVPEWSPELSTWHRSGERVDGTTRTITPVSDGAFREARLAIGTLTAAGMRLNVARTSD